jgi:alpha-1,2-mannosyltransferase
VNSLLASLRNGDFLTPKRLRLWTGALLIGFAAALVYLFASRRGLADAYGRPLGTDFSGLYAAGKLAAAGLPAQAYDFIRMTAREAALFGAEAPRNGWYYPPFALPAAAALAHLPYLPALLLWQGLSFAAYLAAMALLARSQRLGRIWLLPALVFPAVFVNLIHGQTGFLTAALLTSGLTLREKRPLAAGILFGMMAYKPQFALLLPVALIAGKDWKTLAAAALTALALAGAATLTYGVRIWSGFFAALRFGREIVLEQGGAGFEKLQSLFAFLRHLGGDVDFAYLVQGVLALGVAIAVAQLWHRATDRRLKSAGLALGTLLVTPYCFDYDMMALAPAFLLLAVHGRERGFVPYEKTALALLFFVPLLARPLAGAIFLPLGFLAMAWTFLLIVRRPHRLGAA